MMIFMHFVHSNFYYIFTCKYPMYGKYPSYDIGMINNGYLCNWDDIWCPNK